LMSKRIRRKHPSSLKAALLKKHHVEKVPVSDVCDEAEVQPSLFYIWQRQLFETAKTALDGGRKGASGQEKALAARVAELEAQLAEKDAVIAKKDAVIAENSEEFVKVRNAWGALKGRWVPHDTRDEVVDFVRAWSAKTEIAADRFIRENTPLRAASTKGIISPTRWPPSALAQNVL
jgi:transposase